MAKTETLRKLQLLELKIALEIKRVCEKNGLRFFLTGGTLLGAVRHGGFIPWDDDMDISFSRSDYDAFTAACKTDLGPEFLLQTWDTDPSYPFPAGKIRLKGTHAQERFSAEGNENGIYVDIFPFDNVPDGAWAYRLQSWRYYLGKRLLWMKKGYGRCIAGESIAKKFKYHLAAVLVAPLPYARLKRWMDRAMRRYDNEPTRLAIVPGVYSFSRETIDRSWLDDLAPVSFEGHTFPAFRRKEEYLRKVYGDYMRLPPEDQRAGHEFTILDFGPYDTSGAPP